MLRNLHTVAVALVLLFLLCIPLAILLYAVNPLLGGLLLLTPLVTLQVLTLRALQRRFPSNPTTADAIAEELNHETHETNERKNESPLIDAYER
jgi:CBS domain containing-hemolysin-like protein